MRGLSRARWFAAQVVVPAGAARLGLRTHAASTASTARDTMHEYRNLHQRGPGGGSGDDQFTIKAHGAYPPDWVAAAIGAERAYGHIGAVASFELECAVENLQARYDWIGSRWWTAGRSGGWLLLADDDRPLERYDDVLWRLEAALSVADADADDVRAAMHEYRASVDTLTARARELRAIEQELRAGVRDFERYAGSRECWEGIVPRRRRRPLLRRWRAGDKPSAWRRT